MSNPVWSPAFAAVAMCAFLIIPGPLVSGAAGDIGVIAQSRTVARPGEPVEVRVACGGCESGTGFPVSMVTRVRYPEPYLCGKKNNALCTPGAARPPRNSPYVLLGNTEAIRASTAKRRTTLAESVLRFKVPRVEPGRYVLVIFCGPCMRGPNGMLITSPNTRRGNLRVLPAASTSALAATRESSSGGVSAWAWPAGVLVLVLGFGLTVWSRGSLGSASH